MSSNRGKRETAFHITALLIFLLPFVVSFCAKSFSPAQRLKPKDEVVCVPIDENSETQVFRSVNEKQIFSKMEPVSYRPNLPDLSKICSNKKILRKNTKNFIYKTKEIVVEPVDFGPQIIEKPRNGIPIVLEDVVRRVEEHGDKLKQCYRWARYKNPLLAGNAKVKLDFDPIGVLTSITVFPMMENGVHLSLCVEDVLQDLAINRYTLRKTYATVFLKFKLSGQSVPSKRPIRPRRANRAMGLAQGICIDVPKRPNVDELSANYAVLTVDDFDEHQAEIEHKQKCKKEIHKWIKSGQKGFPPKCPTLTKIVAGKVSGFPFGDTRYLTEPIMENLGAYRRCYLNAVSKGFDKEGVIVFTSKTDEGGNVKAQVVNSNVTSSTLEECLRKAIEDVWYYTLPDWPVFTVTIPLRLSLKSTRVISKNNSKKNTISAVEKLAVASLTRKNGNNAIRYYYALLQQTKHHPNTCFWLVGILKSLTLVAPWTDDRVLDAAQLLADFFAANKKHTFIKKCIKEAEPILIKLATKPHRDSQTFGRLGLLKIAIQRYRFLLNIEPALINANELRFYLAEAFYRLGEYEQAATLYEYVIKVEPKGKYAEYSRPSLKFCRENINVRKSKAVISK